MKKKVSLCCTLIIVAFCMAIAHGATAAIVDFNGPMSLDALIAGSAAGNQFRVDDKIFSGFTYAFSGSQGAQVLAPSSITVTPITDALNPGLQFTGMWFAQNGQFLVSSIGYGVATAAAGNATNGMSLEVLGGSVGRGVVAAFESARPLGAGGAANILAYATDASSHLFNSAAFDPTSGTFRVSEGLGVISRGLFAEILVLKNQFSEVPSAGAPVPIPGSILLVGPGLAGLAIVRKRLGVHSG